MKALSLLAVFGLIGALLHAEDSTIALDVRYERIRKMAATYGPGGSAVLETARKALHHGNYSLVGLEDLWAIALKEGRTLFGSSSLWGITGPAETGDMLGQSTIGPWQIALQNGREGCLRYRLKFSELEKNHELQARIAADLIEEAYKTLGKRTPLAIQKYFWLDAFLAKRIGQGHWYASVLSADASARQQTGFYAKQVLLGSRFNPEGLLYWLYVTGDRKEIERVLRAWQNTGYGIEKGDLKHCNCPMDFQRALIALLPASN